jgi:hypothetical protein
MYLPPHNINNSVTTEFVPEQTAGYLVRLPEHPIMPPSLPPRQNISPEYPSSLVTTVTRHASTPLRRAAMNDNRIPVKDTYQASRALAGEERLHATTPTRFTGGLGDTWFCRRHSTAVVIAHCIAEPAS